MARYWYPDKNYQREKSNFSPSLKKANITPVSKRGDRNSKDNYRPVSILPNISKIFERCIFRQLYSFIFEFLSKYQCGFRKIYSTTQHCLLAMLEKWKSALDKGKSFGALLTDLSKAFDCLSHELLAKLHAYGFSIAILILIHSYLTEN